MSIDNIALSLSLDTQEFDRDLKQSLSKIPTEVGIQIDLSLNSSVFENKLASVLSNANDNASISSTLTLNDEFFQKKLNSTLTGAESLAAVEGTLLLNTNPFDKSLSSSLRVANAQTSVDYQLKLDTKDFDTSLNKAVDLATNEVVKKARLDIDTNVTAQVKTRTANNNNNNSGAFVATATAQVAADTASAAIKEYAPEIQNTLLSNPAVKQALVRTGLMEKAAIEDTLRANKAAIAEESRQKRLTASQLAKEEKQAIQAKLKEEKATQSRKNKLVGAAVGKDGQYGRSPDVTSSNLGTEALTETVKELRTIAKGVSSGKTSFIGGAAKALASPIVNVAKGYQLGIGQNIADRAATVYINKFEKTFNTSIEALADKSVDTFLDAGRAIDRGLKESGAFNSSQFMRQAKLIRRNLVGTESQQGILDAKTVGKQTKVAQKTVMDTISQVTKIAGKSVKGNYRGEQGLSNYREDVGVLKQRVTGTREAFKGVKDTVGQGYNEFVNRQDARVAKIAERKANQLIKKGLVETTDSQTPIVTVVGGFAGEKGKSGDAVAEKLKQLATGEMKLNVVTNLNSDVETSSSKDLSAWQKQAGQKVFTDILKGVNHDAVNVAAVNIANRKVNPFSPISTLGYSNGGAVASRSTGITNQYDNTVGSRKERVEAKSVAIGTPSNLLGKDAANHESILLKGDGVKGLGKALSKIGLATNSSAPNQNVEGLKSHVKDAYLANQQVVSVINSHLQSQNVGLQTIFNEHEAFLSDVLTKYHEYGQALETDIEQRATMNPSLYAMVAPQSKEAIDKTKESLKSSLMGSARMASGTKLSGEDRRKYVGAGLIVGDATEEGSKLRALLTSFTLSQNSDTFGVRGINSNAGSNSFDGTNLELTPEVAQGIENLSEDAVKLLLENLRKNLTDEQRGGKLLTSKDSKILSKAAIDAAQFKAANPLANNASVKQVYNKSVDAQVYANKAVRAFINEVNQAESELDNLSESLSGYLETVEQASQQNSQTYKPTNFDFGRTVEAKPKETLALLQDLNYTKKGLAEVYQRVTKTPVDSKATKSEIIEALAKQDYSEVVKAISDLGSKVYVQSEVAPAQPRTRADIGARDLTIEEKTFKIRNDAKEIKEQAAAALKVTKSEEQRYKIAINTATVLRLQLRHLQQLKANTPNLTSSENLKLSTAMTSVRNRIPDLQRTAKAAKEAGNIGADFNEGFALGIGNHHDVSDDAAERMGVDALAALRRAIDSHSPSKETIDIGGDFADGGEIGIEQGTENVEKAASNLGKKALDAFNEAQKSGMKALRANAPELYQVGRHAAKNLNATFKADGFKKAMVDSAIKGESGVAKLSRLASVPKQQLDEYREYQLQRAAKLAQHRAKKQNIANVGDNFVTYASGITNTAFGKASHDKFEKITGSNSQYTGRRTGRTSSLAEFPIAAILKPVLFALRNTSRDSIETAARGIKAKEVNPDVSITNVGHSLGARIVENTSQILNRLGVESKSVGIATSLHTPNTAKNHTDLMGTADKVSQIGLVGRKVKRRDNSHLADDATGHGVGAFSEFIKELNIPKNDSFVGSVSDEKINIKESLEEVNEALEKSLNNSIKARIRQKAAFIREKFGVLDKSANEETMKRQLAYNAIREEFTQRRATLSDKEKNRILRQRGILRSTRTQAQMNDEFNKLSDREVATGAKYTGVGVKKLGKDLVQDFASGITQNSQVVKDAAEKIGVLTDKDKAEGKTERHLTDKDVQKALNEPSREIEGSPAMDKLMGTLGKAATSVLPQAVTGFMDLGRMVLRLDKEVANFIEGGGLETLKKQISTGDWRIEDEEFVSLIKSTGILAAGLIGLAALKPFAGLVKSAFEARKAVDSLYGSYNFTGVENRDGFLAAQVKQANKSGTDVSSYTRLESNLKNTLGEAATPLATSLANSLALKGIDSDSSTRFLVGIQQMAGKGVVSMEELRQQLSEALPESMSVAAESMGMPISQFNKLVSSGSLLSSEFLPKFAAQLAKTTEGTGNLNQQMARLSNNWLLFKDTLGRKLPIDTGLQVVSKVLQGLAVAAPAVALVLTSLATGAVATTIVGVIKLVQSVTLLQTALKFTGLVASRAGVGFAALVAGFLIYEQVSGRTQKHLRDITSRLREAKKAQDEFINPKYKGAGTLNSLTPGGRQLDANRAVDALAENQQLIFDESFDIRKSSKNIKDLDAYKQKYDGIVSDIEKIRYKANNAQALGLSLGDTSALTKEADALQEKLDKSLESDFHLSKREESLKTMKGQLEGINSELAKNNPNANVLKVQKIEIEADIKQAEEELSKVKSFVSNYDLTTKISIEAKASQESLPTKIASSQIDSQMAIATEALREGKTAAFVEAKTRVQSLALKRQEIALTQDALAKQQAVVGALTGGQQAFVASKTGGKTLSSLSLEELIKLDSTLEFDAKASGKDRDIKLQNAIEAQKASIEYGKNLKQSGLDAVQIQLDIIEATKTLRREVVQLGLEARNKALDYKKLQLDIDLFRQDRVNPVKFQAQDVSRQLKQTILSQTLAYRQATEGINDFNYGLQSSLKDMTMKMAGIARDMKVAVVNSVNGYASAANIEDKLGFGKLRDLLTEGIGIKQSSQVPSLEKEKVDLGRQFQIEKRNQTRSLEQLKADTEGQIFDNKRRIEETQIARTKARVEAPLDVEQLKLRVEQAKLDKEEANRNIKGVNESAKEYGIAERANLVTVQVPEIDTLDLEKTTKEIDAFYANIINAYTQANQALSKIQAQGISDINKVMAESSKLNQQRQAMLDAEISQDKERQAQANKALISKIEGSTISGIARLGQEARTTKNEIQGVLDTVNELLSSSGLQGSQSEQAAIIRDKKILEVDNKVAEIRDSKRELEKQSAFDNYGLGSIATFNGFIENSGDDLAPEVKNALRGASLAIERSGNYQELKGLIEAAIKAYDESANKLEGNKQTIAEAAVDKYNREQNRAVEDASMATDRATLDSAYVGDKKKARIVAELDLIQSKTDAERRYQDLISSGTPVDVALKIRTEMERAAEVRFDRAIKDLSNLKMVMDAAKQPLENLFKGIGDSIGKSLANTFDQENLQNQMNEVNADFGSELLALQEKYADDPAALTEATERLQMLNDVKLDGIRGQFDLLGSVINSLKSAVLDFAATIAQTLIQQGVNSLIGNVLPKLMFSQGGEVQSYSNGGGVGNYAKGGGVIGLAKAMAKERRLSGKRPVPIVAHEGEQILTTLNGDAQFFRSLQTTGMWDSLKAGNKPDLFAYGGEVGGGSLTPGVRMSASSGSSVVVNSNITVQAKDVNSFYRSQTQVAASTNQRLQEAQKRNS